MPQCCRPYWYTALVCAFIGYTYVGIKLCFLQRALRPAPLAVVLAFLGFCTAHVLIARDVMLWARRRYEMGLIGFGYPWEVSLSASQHCPSLLLCKCGSHYAAIETC